MIRLWVMGEAANQRAATAEEQAAMQGLLRACLEAGAVGLGGEVAFEEELEGAGAVEGDANGVPDDAGGPAGDLAQQHEVAGATGLDGRCGHGDRVR
ncbi:MAG: hypothetical protein ACK55I_23050, partial [bacterium]